MVDFAKLQDDFPILATKVNGKPLCYLDSAASSQKPRMVLDALQTAYAETYANVHRGLHYLSEASTDAYEAVRLKVANLIHAPSPDEVIFTSGATMSLNLIAQCWGSENVGPEDEILITIAEHHANIVPWQMVANKCGAKLVAAPMGPDGAFDKAAFAALVTPKTKVISIPHVSNVLGTVFPLKEIAEMARAVNALFVVDGCQGVVHMPVDVQEIDCDFYVFSGHKLYGPSGIGICWGKRQILDTMPPFMGGGDMIDDVEIERSTYAEVPARFEAGTPPIAECIGLGAAIDYVQMIGMAAIHDHEQKLIKYGMQRLSEVDDIRFIGTAAGKSGVISFTLDDIHPHDISTLIDHDGIAIRAGHHCAQPLMKSLGLSSTARASVALYNQESDFDVLAESLHKVNRIFKS
ncbi:MAG: cysteine desulfurase [Candidatus Puniceispirillaceae bacterium]